MTTFSRELRMYEAFYLAKNVNVTGIVYGNEGSDL
jgi:hypothetical protein